MRMRKPPAIAFNLILSAFTLFLLIFPPQALAADQFTLTSPQISPGDTLSQDQVYDGFGCTGANISPALEWSGVPPETKSFVLTVFDPDAPTGLGGFVHWVIFNIPATETALPENAGNPERQLAPEESIQTVNDYGEVGFGGACPPPRDAPHRYQFTLYALKARHLDLDSSIRPAVVGFQANYYAIAKASLETYYGRPEL